MNRLLRDIIMVQLALMLSGLAIDLIVRADLGTTPWVVFEAALTHYLPITLGQSVILVSVVLLGVILVARQPLGWGTLVNIACLGLWVDWMKPLVPVIPSVLPLQIAYLVLGTATFGVASAIFVGSRAGAGPRDSLMLVLARVTRLSLRTTRTLIEVTVVTVGWLLGGPVGLGTLFFALTIGPTVQLAMRTLRLTPMPLATAPEPEGP